MKKTAPPVSRNIYIIDTSVLAHDPNSIKSFTGSDVVLPINVLDELDKLKTFPNDAGKNARVCIRQLDKICNLGDIIRGVSIPGDIMLRIDNTITDDKFGTTSYVDNRILACADLLNIKNSKKKSPSKVILVSRDINLRIRARAIGVMAEDYEKDRTPVSDMYQGFVEITNDAMGDALVARGTLDCAGYPQLKKLAPNECIHIQASDGSGLAMGRRHGDKLKLIQSRTPWGLTLRNKEQAFAVDMLCDKRLPLVTLIGKAGTGKSLIALAAALEMVGERKEYNRLIIYRPIQSVGKDIGYLPGSLEEKLAPWMQAIFDSLEVLFTIKAGSNWKRSLDYMIDRGLIEMEAITYIRGRSIPNAIILIDEAQNLSKEEIKTILTRAGNGSRIILTGDVDQIDTTNLDATNNGLTYVVEKFKHSNLAGHITFTKGERSELATLAANIL